jgi:protein-tyrosine phosphatase
MDLAAHRSKTLLPDEVAAFDLVLTAARAQAREIVAEAPDAWPRVFTLKQFSGWVQDRTWDREVPLRRWLATEAADRPRRELLGDSRTDDIRDPVDGSERLWREVAAEINEQLRRGLVPLFA